MTGVDRRHDHQHFAGQLAARLHIASGNLMRGNLDAGDIDCAGNIDAASYTISGVPMVMLTQSQLDRIEARLAALEERG